MTTQTNFISAEIFCANHQIDLPFVLELNNTGLIEMNFIDNAAYLSEVQLPIVEKIIRLHFELDINMEGIEAVTHLLSRIDALEQHLIRLQNKIQFYEGAGFL